MKAVNFGIDLGTTNSLIAKYEDNKVVIFKNPIGHKDSLASVVAFRKDRILVGDKAREYAQKDPVNVFSSFKRRMGTDEKFYVVNIDDNIVPIDLSAYVLRELQQFVHTGEKIEAAVITIPASFDTMQSNATKEAGMKAGFQEVFLLQEPIAASLAYFNNKKDGDESGYWLVYDLGGGTFDVALIQIQDGEMKVKDHEGNNFLGGVDFDRMIVEKLLVPEIVKQSGSCDFEEELFKPYSKYEKLFYELLYKAEDLKKELSVQASSEINFSTEIDSKEYDFYITITKEQFELLIEKRINDTIQMVLNIISRNQLYPKDIKEIVLVGGSTLIPYVRKELQRQTNIQVNSSIDPTSAVAVGAAFYAANKYYQPIEEIEEEIEEKVDEILGKIVAEDYKERKSNVKVDLSYSKMSKEEEEVLLIRLEGEYEDLNLNYRIIRQDGGFDTGFIKAKAKYTEFLPLLPGVANNFTLRFYDANGEEIASLRNEISISQGQYNISGQPLPKDICIEVDDRENNTTRLELIFEKNSILPLRKTLYREISKTIKKGSSDNIVINILEGDRHARALSNLTIGCVEISGNDLTTDLLKGSDIEIQISISDNRELKTQVYLVMTQQEFKNVFTLSEKQVSVARLKELFFDLEAEIRKALKRFSNSADSTWVIQTDNLLNDLLSYSADLIKLHHEDKSDRRYVIAEAISRISQEFDKIGGYDRLEELQTKYMEAKEETRRCIEHANFDKENLYSKFDQITKNESQFLLSRNASIVNRIIENLETLAVDAKWSTISGIISFYLKIKAIEPEYFKNYVSASNIFVLGDKAMENEKYLELRQHTINLINLVRFEKEYAHMKDFKGTGIG